MADKRQRDPSKRAVLAGKCKQPEGIICDTPYVPRSVLNPMDVIPDTDARPRGDSSQFSFDTRCKRHLDFGEEPLPAVEFSERAPLFTVSNCAAALAPDSENLNTSCRECDHHDVLLPLPPEAWVLWVIRKG